MMKMEWMVVTTTEQATSIVTVQQFPWAGPRYLQSIPITIATANEVMVYRVVVGEGHCDEDDSDCVRLPKQGVAQTHGGPGPVCPDDQTQQQLL